jgi:hypothetical protein
MTPAATRSGRWLPGSAIALAMALGGLAPTPAGAQAAALTRSGAIPGAADAIRVQGDRAFIAAGRTLTVFDLANPASPRRLGSHTFPEEIWGFRVYGPLILVAANFYGIGILHMSPPGELSLLGSYKTLGQAKGAALHTNRILLVDHMAGVDLLDVSNAASPVSLGKFFLDGYARDVVTKGSIAYAVDSPTGLYAFDLSSANPLEPVNTQQSASGARSVEAGEGDGAIVCVAGGGMLHVYDVSVPSTPVKAGSLKIPAAAQRVALLGSLAYVAAGGEGLLVVDVTTPAEPKVVGKIETPSPARDVAAGDGVVLVAVAPAPGSTGTAEVIVLKPAP